MAANISDSDLTYPDTHFTKRGNLGWSDWTPPLGIWSATQVVLRNYQGRTCVRLTLRRRMACTSDEVVLQNNSEENSWDSELQSA
jgi:hypothetical protein